MLPEALVADVIAHALRGGASFAELYVERWKRRALRVLNAEVKEATSGLEYGAGIRLFYGTEVAYAYTNDLTPSALLEVTDNLVRVKRTAGRVDSGGRGGLDFRKVASRGLHTPAVPFDEHPKRYRLERLCQVDAGARIAPEIAQVESNLQEWEQDVLVANSEGTWAEDRRVRTRLYANAIARDNGTVQTGTAWEGLSVGLELFDRFPPAEVGRRAGEQALTNLRARPAPAGTMPVVIGNAFGGVIFHEAVGHLLETTSVAKKASVLSDMIGQQVASPVVTYIDDGTTPHGWGSSEFDDEGAPTRQTVLIDRGILKSYMRSTSVATLEPGRTALEFTERTGRLLGARPLRTGRYRAYLEPKAAAALLAAFSPMWNGKNIAERKSPLAGRLGDAIASRLVTLIDDPLLPEGLASRPVDAEGTPARRTVLVEGGILKAYLTNSETAKTLGMANTGHASRTYRGILWVAPSNLYLAPGTGAPFTEGVVIAEVMGLHAGTNAVTGDFSVQALGLWVEDGKVAYPVENFAVAGNILTLLTSITALGPELKWEYGGRVAYGSPMVEVRELSFAGA